MVEWVGNIRIRAANEGLTSLQAGLEYIYARRVAPEGL